LYNIYNFNSSALFTPHHLPTFHPLLTLTPFTDLFIYPHLTFYMFLSTLSPQRQSIQVHSFYGLELHSRENTLSSSTGSFKHNLKTVCLSVCLLATLRKNCSWDLQQYFTRDASVEKKRL